jgi:hypothetical protein
MPVPEFRDEQQFRLDRTTRPVADRDLQRGGFPDDVGDRDNVLETASAWRAPAGG